MLDLAHGLCNIACDPVLTTLHKGASGKPTDHNAQRQTRTKGASSSASHPRESSHSQSDVLAAHYSIGEDLHCTFLAAAPNPFTAFQGVKPISLPTGLLPLLENGAVVTALLGTSRTDTYSSGEMVPVSRSSAAMSTEVSFSKESPVAALLLQVMSVLVPMSSVATL